MQFEEIEPTSEPDMERILVLSDGNLKQLFGNYQTGNLKQL